jgi:phage terminase large subunit-like protein
VTSGKAKKRTSSPRKKPTIKKKAARPYWELGRVGADQMEQHTYARAQRDHARERNKTFAYRWDAARGERPVRFIESYCRLVTAEWRGRPMILSDFQKFILREGFGWVRKDDGARRFTTILLFAGRKFGKSEFAAAIGLYMLCHDDEGTPEIYSSATDREQAAIVFDKAADMVTLDETLSSLVEKRGGQSNTDHSRAELACPENGGVFQPLAAESRRLHGLATSCHLCDELHAHRDSRLWNVIETGTGSRRQPLTFGISTAGVADITRIGYQKYDLARKVVEGAIPNESLFVMICEPDDDRDMFSEQAWLAANPHFPITPKRAYLEKMALQAQQEPSFFGEYLNLCANKWTNDDETWIRMEFWAECTSPSGTEIQDGAQCSLGLDLSSTNDLTSWSAVFPLGSGRYAVRSRSYMPEERVAYHFRAGRKHFAQWVESGDIIATPGRVINYEYIHKDILEFGQTYQITAIGYDPRMMAQTINALGERDGFNLVEVGQGFGAQTPACRMTERLITEGKLIHFDDPVLTFCVRNASVDKSPDGGLKLSKKRLAPHSKIDALSATVNALALFVKDDQEPPEELEFY